VKLKKLQRKLNVKSKKQKYGSNKLGLVNSNYSNMTSHIQEKKLDHRIKEMLGVSGPLIDQSQALPQVNVVEIQVPLNPDALVALAYSWPVYAVSKNVAVGAVNTVGESDISVGLHWFMAYTLFYDLWLATKDTRTILANAPLSYWELRSALTPKVIKTPNGGYGYVFTSPDAFDQFVATITGSTFPLQVGQTSLAWVITPIGGLYPVITVPPNISEDDIKAGGSSITQFIWSQMQASDHQFELIEIPVRTAFSDSTAAFCAVYDYSTPENMNWSLFSHEVSIFGNEQWLAILGLTLLDTSNSGRRGPHTFTEYRGNYSYNHRILRGVTGKEKKQVIRFKFVFF